MTDNANNFEPYDPLSSLDAFKKRQKDLAPRAKVESKSDAVRVDVNGAIISDTSTEEAQSQEDTELGNETTAEDAQGSEEEISDGESLEKDTLQSESTESDNSSNKRDWEKSYYELQSHHNRKLNEELEQKKQLQEKLEAAKAKSLDILSEDDLESMFKDHPDLIKAIESKVYHSLSRQSKEVDEKLKALQERQQVVDQKESLNKLLGIHPDAKEIASTDKFRSWYDKQPAGIQSLYNSYDIEEVSMVLTKYKTDTGITKVQSSKKSRQVTDSLAVKKSSSESQKISKGNKVWKESEVAKMSISQYQKHEADIMKAMSEGRFEYDGKNRYNR